MGPLPGSADRAALTAWVKDTTWVGLAIVDASSFTKPRMLAELELDGVSIDVAADALRGIAAIAAGFVDMPVDAAALLDEAGWVPGADGIREKDGKKLHILYQTSVNPVRQDFQALVKDWWTELGVEVELKNIDASVFPPAVGASTTAFLPSRIASPASSCTALSEVHPRRETIAC